MSTDTDVFESVGDVDVTQLGLHWFRSLLSDQPGTGVEIDAELVPMGSAGAKAMAVVNGIAEELFFRGAAYAAIPATPGRMW